MAELPTPVLVIASLFILAWLGLVARMAIGALGRRRLRRAADVGAADAGSRDGETVTVTGLVRPGPAGIVRAHRTGIEGAWARYRVVRSVDYEEDDPAAPGGSRTVTRTDVEEEVELPTADAVLEVHGPTGAVVRVRVADLESTPADRVHDVTAPLERPFGARRAVRIVTEDVIPHGLPVTLRGTVEVREGATWLVPTLGVKVEAKRS